MPVTPIQRVVEEAKHGLTRVEWTQDEYDSFPQSVRDRMESEMDAWGMPWHDEILKLSESEAEAADEIMANPVLTIDELTNLYDITSRQAATLIGGYHLWLSKAPKFEWLATLEV